MTNRQIAALETRKKLVAAAKEIIYEKGLANTSVEEITKACGVSNGTFYTYFKKKEDIVFELSQDTYRELFEKAMGYNGTIIEKIVFYMINFSGYIEKSGLKLCQEWVRNVADPDLTADEQGKNKMSTDIESLRKLIETGIRSGELKAETPADVLAHTLNDILYGEMLCWDISGGAYSFEDRTKEFCETFFDSIIKPYFN